MKWILCVLLLWSLQATGQKLDWDNPGTPEQRAGMMTDSMKLQLRLDDGQVPKVYALNLKYARIMQKEVVETDRNKLSKYWKGNEINGRKETELKKLLTPEQWKAYERMKSDRMKKIMGQLF